MGENKKKLALIIFVLLILAAIIGVFFYLRKDEGGDFCGGIANVECSEGYYCDYEGDYPDASGVCRKDLF
jgi:hypothetical protein